MFNVNDVLKCAGLLLNMRGSDHPIINNCRDLLFGGMTSYRNTGTLVSLFSKLKRKGTASMDDALVRANYERVVKAYEMQHIMQALHSSTLTTGGGEKEEDVVLGNKLAVLVGDLFLTLAFKEITDIQDSTVLETFSKGVELFATPDFEETPRRPSIDWWEKCSAEKRSWLASAFECSVLVAGLRCDDEREAARKCGRNLVLTMQRKSPGSVQARSTTTGVATGVGQSAGGRRRGMCGDGCEALDGVVDGGVSTRRLNKVPGFGCELVGPVSPEQLHCGLNVCRGRHSLQSLLVHVSGLLCLWV
ncbi:unnamed protein product [Ixodes pacificus]